MINEKHRNISLIDERDWKSKWIWGGQGNIPNIWMCFRKFFVLPEGICSAKAWISAETKYWFWLNGRQVVYEGGLNRGPEPGKGYYDTVDLKDYIVQGGNTIAILVWYWGNEGRNNSDSGEGGLLFEADFCGDTGSGSEKIVVCSDISWKKMIYTAYGNTGDPQPSYLYGGHNIGFDARKDMTGWYEKTFDDQKWENAEEKGCYPCKPWSILKNRPIPMIKDYGIKEYVKLIAESGNRIRAGLPYAAQVSPFFKINSRSDGLKIDIRTDRYFVNGGPGDSHNVYNGHRVEYITRCGVQEFEAFNWFFGEEVIYTIPDGVEVLSLGYRETGYYCGFSGNFSCSSDFLNKLYEKSRRTLYVCMRDNYMDCPDRERGQWIGDVSSQIPQTFYALERSSDSLTLKAIRDFIRWRKGDILCGNVPGAHRVELPSQSLNAISEFGMIMTYYKYSGDEQIIYEAYEAVRDYLKLWEINKNGLVQLRRGDWQWYDHGSSIDAGVLENAWYYTALKAAEKMADITKRHKDHEWYAERIDAIKANFDKAFWTDKGYSSSGIIDDRANAVAVLSGLADEDKWLVCRNVLVGVMNSTPYMEGYVLEALCKMGFVRDALIRMSKRYESLTANSCTTLWEDFFELGTKNHAWSGGPLTVLLRYVAGIDAETPGYGIYHVLPQVCDLSKVSAVVPSIKGNICADIVREKNIFSLLIESPKRTSAIVGIPKNNSDEALKQTFCKKSHLNRILVDHEVVWSSEPLTDKRSDRVIYYGENEQFVMFRIKPGRSLFTAFY